MDELKKTPLTKLHQELGAKMTAFAGFEMPLQFDGVMAEHLQTRASAGLFDVSHMGQIRIKGDDADLALETLMPQTLVELGVGRQRYGFLTTPTGGIIDDVMVARAGHDQLDLVVNAGGRNEVLTYLQEKLTGLSVEPQFNRGLLALQGPLAEDVLASLLPTCRDMAFMDRRNFDSPFGDLVVSRSGYTGEDGFEISIAPDQAEPLARSLLDDPRVAPVGLAARDTLRMEAGLCLYGADIDQTTTPVTAGLSWAIQNARRADGARAGGFPGADQILAELGGAPDRRRVGLRPEGRAPVRSGVQLYPSETAPDPCGHVTSGGYGPSVAAPIAMGYVPNDLTNDRIWGEVRGKRLPIDIVPLPFVPNSFKR